MSLFTIKSAGGSEMEITDAIPSGLGIPLIPHASPFYAHGNAGRFAFQQIPTSLGSWWYSQYQIDHTLELTGQANFPVLEIFSSLRNHIPSNWEGIGIPSTKEHAIGIAYTPYVNNKAKLMGGQVYETMDFHPDPAWLAELIGGITLNTDRFLSATMKKQPASMDAGSRITPGIRRIFFDIATPDCYATKLDRYIEIKTELFVLEAFWLIDPQRATTPSILSDPLKEKAMHAEKILRERLDDPPSIAELARLVMSNTQTVQQIFKKQFGQTIDEYSRKLRIELAKQFLLDTDMDLHAIAFETGYHDASALSVAFKRLVGCTPGQFRKAGGLT